MFRPRGAGRNATSPFRGYETPKCQRLTYRGAGQFEVRPLGPANRPSRSLSQAKKSVLALSSRTSTSIARVFAIV